MASDKQTLELLFNKLHENDYDSVTNSLPDAVREYKALSQELSREEKRKVNFIKSLIDYCHSGRWLMATHLLEPAEEEFYRYFFRKQTPRAKRHLQVNFDLQSNKVHGHDRTNSRSGPQALSSNIDDARGIPGSGLMQNMVPRPSTDMTDLSSVADIVDKFVELFRNEWRDALDELEHLKVNEIDAAAGLLRIVMDVYKYCTTEADTQIGKMEQAIQKIILEGTNNNRNLEGDRSYLTDYRRELAGVCLERLQESFRRRYLPEIIRSVGIYQNLRTHGPVHRYTEQCVAICWAMSICDPQLFLVDDRNKHGPFNKELYNEYTISGQSVAFYVWPPLQASTYGKLLSKGIAQCHL